MGCDCAFLVAVGAGLRRSELSPLPSSYLCRRRSGGSVGRKAAVVSNSISDAPGAGEKYVVTTPLFYVNGRPHLGSAYTTMAVDALTRSLKMNGLDALMVTGSDEHGEKIKLAAEKNGKEPQQHCDEMTAEFEKLFAQLGIDYNRYIRTTSPKHEKVVLEFMERVWQKGDIYKSEYEGLYCTGCEEYKDKKELLEDSICPIHRTPCDPRKEENYFFALSKYQKQIEELHANNPNFVMPERSRNEVLGWVDDGLRDFSVSRANNPWGIPIPRDPSQTIYVWFDALLGYISSLLEPEDEASLTTAISRGWPAHVHVIGKDILRFHAIYWPAMLMSAGVELPAKVYGHGFLTKDGLKMGKSLGNTVDPFDLVETYGEDAVRYYFLRAIEFGEDGDYARDRFINVVNSDLANNLGNLLNRCLNLLRKNCDLTLATNSSEIESELRQRLTTRMPLVASYFQNMRFASGCALIMECLNEANVYIAGEEPWAMFKKGEKVAAEQCLCECLECVRACAVALKPVTPHLSESIYLALGFSLEEWKSLTWRDAEWGGLESGRTFPKPVPVFPRIEAKEPVLSN